MPLHQTRFDGGATAEQLNCSAKTPRGQRVLTPCVTKRCVGFLAKPYSRRLVFFLRMAGRRRRRPLQRFGLDKSCQSAIMQLIAYN